MSFEEMEEEDSTYIQEAKLKRKAMKVNKKNCVSLFQDEYIV